MASMANGRVSPESVKHGTSPESLRLSLSKTLYPLLSTSLTQEDSKLSQHDRKIVDWDIKHQHKQTIKIVSMMVVN